MMTRTQRRKIQESIAALSLAQAQARIVDLRSIVGSERSRAAIAREISEIQRSPLWQEPEAIKVKNIAPHAITIGKLVMKPGEVKKFTNSSLPGCADSWNWPPMIPSLPKLHKHGKRDYYHQIQPHL